MWSRADASAHLALLRSPLVQLLRKSPTLLVWGDRGTLSHRRDQEIALSAIRDSTLAVYEGGGHALHWEQPARFAADLVAFVQAKVDERLRRPLAQPHI